MIDHRKLEGIFSPEEINILLQWERNMSSWTERQLFTLLEGYPTDMTSENFKQADESNNDGWDCHEQGQYSEALRFYDQSLALCPDFAMVWNNKGLSHFRLKDFEQAQAAYHEAIKVNPRFIKPYSNLGILYFELRGDKVEAACWFRKALALDPNYQRAKQYLAQCQGEKDKKKNEGRGGILWFGDPRLIKF